MIEISLVGYVKNNMSEKAIELFNEVDHPSESILIALFNACAQLGIGEALILTKKVGKEMFESFYSNPNICSCLLDALIKSGDISSAEVFFSKMLEFLSNYAVLMYGYNKENNFDQTLRLFEQTKTKGIERDFFIFMRSKLHHESVIIHYHNQLSKNFHILFFCIINRFKLV